MASLPHSKTVTYEEWLRMPEVKREEVVNGEIRIMPAPSWNHGDIIENLFVLIQVAGGQAGSQSKAGASLI